MSNQKIHTIEGSIEIPQFSNQFNALPQVVWSGSSVRERPAFTPINGDSHDHENDGGLSGGDGFSGLIELYSPDMGKGIQLTRTVGKEHSINLETHGNGRWLPASCFNGFGFMYNMQFQTSSSTGYESLALRISRYALLFSHRTDDNWFANYSVDIPIEDRQAKNETRYAHINGSSPKAQEIRDLGKDYLLQGFNFNVTTGGGIQTLESRITIFNVRVGHKFSTVGPEYRMLPLRKRAYGHRNRVIEGFTDPFE